MEILKILYADDSGTQNELNRISAYAHEVWTLSKMHYF